ncbi:MAG: hypothetical protein JXI33_06200 [Candidatus Aminicenantes bacterium]|nr:hypothetical protein [Candidatus Aminicenantes bacterium]
MAMNSARRELAVNYALGLIVSATVTAFFSSLFIGASRGNFLFGFLTGLQVYAFISLFSVFIKKRLRRKNMFLMLFVNTLAHIVSIAGAIFMALLILNGFRSGSVLRGLRHPQVHKIILIGMAFGFALSFLFHVVEMFDTLLGKNFLLKILAGHYNHPFEQERFFMFLDLADSTALAEKLGHKKYLSLLNDFYHDLAEPVIATLGEIYKYVGDGVIVSWTMKHGTRHAAPLRCFFMIREIVGRKSATYLKHYGELPRFRAAVHGGTVVTGEMGYIRKEIAFVGDVLNTAARMEAVCRELNRSLVVSQEALQKMNPGPEIVVERLPEVVLRGKQRPLAISAVEWQVPS